MQIFNNRGSRFTALSGIQEEEGQLNSAGIVGDNIQNVPTKNGVNKGQYQAARRENRGLGRAQKEGTSGGEINNGSKPNSTRANVEMRPNTSRINETREGTKTAQGKGK